MSQQVSLVTSDKGILSLSNEGLLPCVLHPSPPPRGLAVLLKPCGLCRLHGGDGEVSAPCPPVQVWPGSVCCALKCLSSGSVLRGSCCDRLHLTEGNVRVQGWGGVRLPGPRAELTTEQPPQHLHTPDMPPLGGEVSPYGPPGFRELAQKPHTACRLAAVTVLVVQVCVRWLAPPETPDSRIPSRGSVPQGPRRVQRPTHSPPWP